MVLSFLHIHIQVYSGYIRTECEVCRTFGCAQHEFKFTAQGVDARRSASLTTESASEKTKGNLVTKKNKTSRYVKQTFAYGLPWLEAHVFAGSPSI